MELDGTSKLLRIFVGERDKLKSIPIYEVIVNRAKKHGLAGATVIRGVMSYGAGNVIHKAKNLSLSFNMPMVIEIVDKADKIDEFITEVTRLFESANCGGLITVENVSVLLYKPGK